jgi:hypothetical protein
MLEDTDRETDDEAGIRLYPRIGMLEDTDSEADDEDEGA